MQSLSLFPSGCVPSPDQSKTWLELTLAGEGLHQIHHLKSKLLFLPFPHFDCSWSFQFNCNQPPLTIRPRILPWGCPVMLCSSCSITGLTHGSVLLFSKHQSQKRKQHLNSHSMILKRRKCFLVSGEQMLVASMIHCHWYLVLSSLWQQRISAEGH